MTTVTLAEAQARLVELLENLEPGSVLTIEHNGTTLAELSKPAASANEPRPDVADEPFPSPTSERPVVGRAIGTRWRPAIVVAVLLIPGVGFWIGLRQYWRAEDKKRHAELLVESEDTFRSGGYDRVIDLTSRVIEADPNNARAYGLRAKARYFHGDEHRALADCDEALRLDPNSATALTCRARVAWLRGPASAGVDDAQRALDLDPNLEEGLTCLALAKLRAGDAKGALETAKQAIERHRDDAEAHLVCASALIELNQSGVKPEYDAAVNSSNGQSLYRAARAEYFVQQAASMSNKQASRMIEAAEADARLAIENNPQCAQAYIAMANVHAFHGRWSDVRALCEKALAINPRLTSAYIRAADDLSPQATFQYRLHQEALMQLLDLREMRGRGDFTVGALWTDIQRLMSAKMGREIFIRVDYMSFPPEARQALRDAKVNLNSLLDASGENLLRGISAFTVLDTLCKQVGATLWVTPEGIEIVELDNAPRLAGRRPRLKAPSQLHASAQLRHQQRRLLFEKALEQPVDLKSLRGSELGALLTDLQQQMSDVMKTDVALYIQYGSFPPEIRQILRDWRINTNQLVDVSGEQPLPNLRFRTILDQIAKHMTSHITLGDGVVKIRATGDYIEIYLQPGEIDEAQIDWDPDRQLFELLRSVLGLKPQPKPKEEPRFAKTKPQPEAIRWLTRGLEAVPESARLYYERSQVYLEMGDFDSAIRDLQKAIEQNPSYKDAIQLLKIANDAKTRPIPMVESII